MCTSCRPPLPPGDWQRHDVNHTFNKTTDTTGKEDMTKDLTTCKQFEPRWAVPSLVRRGRGHRCDRQVALLLADVQLKYSQPLVQGSGNHMYVQNGMVFSCPAMMTDL